MAVGAADVVAIGRHVLEETMADDVLGMAAEMSYRFLFALFPMVIFLAALGAFIADWTGVANPTDEIMDLAGDALPADAASLIRTQLDGVLGSSSGGLLSIGAVAALWAASGGVKAVMKGMNRAYDVEETRPFLRKNLVALGLTLLLTVAVLGGFGLVVVGQFFIEEIASVFGDGAAQEALVAYARWPLAGLILAAGMAFLYWAAPNAGLPFKWISPGSLLFVIVWVLATAGFAVYVQNFGSYNETYGTLGGVIVVLLWFYLTSAIMLVGAELNAVLHHRQQATAPALAAADGASGPRERLEVAGAPGEGVASSLPASASRRALAVFGAAVAALAVLRRAARWR